MTKVYIYNLHIWAEFQLYNINRFLRKKLLNQYNLERLPSLEKVHIPPFFIYLFIFQNVPFVTDPSYSHVTCIPLELKIPKVAIIIL